MKTQCTPGRKPSSRTQQSWHPDLGFLASRTVTNRCCLSHQVHGNLLTAAQAKTPNVLSTSLERSFFRHLSSLKAEEEGIKFGSAELPLHKDTVPNRVCQENTGPSQKGLEGQQAKVLAQTCHSWLRLSSQEAVGLWEKF